MIKTKSLQSEHNLKIFLRALSYSSIIGAVLFLLILLSKENFHQSFFFLAALGFVALVMESYFLVYFANSVVKSKGHISQHKLLHHGINHMFFPAIFYVGLVLSIYYGQDLLESALLAFVGFVLLFCQYLVISKHLVFGHLDDAKSHKHSVKIDFVIYIFKFFSYFVANLALFQALVQNRLSLSNVFLANFLINILFMLSHLNRKQETRKMNIFMAFLFSFITSLFIIQTRMPIINYSATVATIIYYISSGIFVHKVEGTFNSRVLIEYGSVAIILSIFLFSS